eukprot:SAG31_NODE_2720_length_5190_cov_3.678256_4_plen_84_part_00
MPYPLICVRSSDADPDYEDVPLEVLLSEEYNAARRKLVDPKRAAAGLTPARNAHFHSTTSVARMDGPDRAFTNHVIMRTNLRL